MTDSMPPRSHTERLSEGLGLVRWGDSEAVIRALYPAATASAAYRGRDPMTGREILVPASPIIEGFLPMKSRLGIQAVLDCSADGLKEITLSPSGTATGPDDATECLQELATRLGFGSMDDRMDQSWVVQGVKVELFLEVGDFSLTIHRPAPSPG